MKQTCTLTVAVLSGSDDEEEEEEEEPKEEKGGRMKQNCTPIVAPSGKKLRRLKLKEYQ